MFIRTLFVIWLLFLTVASLDGQITRTYDGSFNNLSYIDWGAAHTQLLRVTSIGYGDGVSSLAGDDRPNPRIISNKLFGQEGGIVDPLNMSDFTWVFGQFMDHDLDLSPDAKHEPLLISIPTGDPFFDPRGEGRAVVPMFRSLSSPTTGTDSSNPRQHINAITSWIDGSNVYGSDVERAYWLRTFSGGKLKTSAGDLLPFNTTTGEFNDPIDPNAPEMDNANPLTTKLFVAGDVRANEQPLLTSFHTLFVREHNRLCDEFANQYPAWDDEEIFQHARRYVIGLIQSIAYEDWLPAMGVTLPSYTGYNPNTNPAIMNIFSGAAFRLGHTLVNKELVRLTNEGDTIAQGSIGLKEAFFNPLVLITGGGIDPLFKGMATQTQQKLDCKVVDDLRNFLFGPPGAGGLDLASININRGRERGFPDYNTVRSNFGLPKASQFRDITIDPDMISGLAGVYGNVDNIDPWVGLLAEDHMEGALFGETIMTIMKRQFSALRDGDRFYYEIDPGLTLEEVAVIKATKFVEIIRRNTNIDIMQENVFYAMPHEKVIETNIIHDDEHLDMVVFPNPITDQINLSFNSNEAGPATIQLVDMLGRTLVSRSVSAVEGVNFFSFNFGEQLNQGVYHILVVMNENIGQYKILKQF